MNADYTNAQNQYTLLRSMMGQNLQPVQRANAGTALGKILTSYFLNKGMGGAQAQMAGAEQKETDTRKLDFSRAGGALRGDTTYQLSEDESFDGETIPGLRNEGTGYNPMAFAQSLLGGESKEAQGAGLTALMQAMKPGNQIDPMGKVQPGNYTPESVQRFKQTGNYSVLERAPAKLYKVDRGDRWDFVNPETGAVVRSEDKKLAPNETIPYKTESTTAVEQAKDQVEEEQDQRANAITYTAFNAGMTDYENALKGTLTGYLAGRLPAVTASQQIADGAKSIMLPLLKQLFRSAGEGVFTDKDQELLEGMLPTRKDVPEAAKAKIDMVNKVVAMKLGIPVPMDTPEGAGSAAEEVPDSGGWTIEAVE